ncbi:Creatinase [Ruegeria denitrificans]|uniref:Creatinase n=1 Tax=Ruegeria denitrificans TaxID=1715692 RepID=A0A0N7M8U2_9RHOB|nr:Xaa-Pro peptidase family protein [Ruegeria denitrificans]CUJ90964.1 Creatinase [Ruegeria denitrificans]
MFAKRMQSFRSRMQEADIDVALITDEDNMYYLTGYYDYLHMEFGRPTVLVIHRDGESLLITPTIDLNTAQAAAKVDRIAAWNDGMGDEWRAELPDAVKGVNSVGIEPDSMPPMVRRYVDVIIPSNQLVSAASLLSDMRMVKSFEELQLARHAGEVATAMMEAGRQAIGHGVPEYEVALATSQAGTRKAAALLAAHYTDAEMSPNTHFLQIMASGDAIIKTHHRATTRIMQQGDPVFLCFCGMTNFHRFKLGFDRTFWIGDIKDKQQERVYEVAVASQAAALDALRPGVTAESVHAAYAEVIESNGYEYPFRCGRATGFSFLEKPQLVTGDKTVLRPGMVFAVDGSVSIDSFRAQVGDSFIITEDGWEAITEHPKSLDAVII